MIDRLLGRMKPASEGEALTDEELKAQRIQFHRDHVRNGPQKWRTISTGQQRRQRDRDMKALQKKATRTHRRAWHQRKAEFATLRGHLTILGVLEGHGTEFTRQQTQTSLEWVVAKFGERDDDGNLVLNDNLVGDAVEAARAAFLKVVEAAKVGA